MGSRKRLSRALRWSVLGLLAAPPIAVAQGIGAVSIVGIVRERYVGSGPAGRHGGRDVSGADRARALVGDCGNVTGNFWEFTVQYDV